MVWMQLFWILVIQGMWYEKMCFQLPGCNGNICIAICVWLDMEHVMMSDKVNNKQPKSEN